MGIKDIKPYDVPISAKLAIAFIADFSRQAPA